MGISAASRDGRSRWLPVAAVLLVGLLGGNRVSPGTTEPASTADPTGTDARAGVIGDDDRETILSMVREHRRQANEDWLNTLADAIYRESVEAAVDPLLVASIVAKESSFRTRAVSQAGAVGLMQLRPWVARDVAHRFHLEWAGHETLHSPALNVRLGILYYKELMERFEGDATKALTAYNYGPTRVSRQLREGSYAASSYARRVLELYGQLSARRQQDA